MKRYRFGETQSETAMAGNNAISTHCRRGPKRAGSSARRPLFVRLAAPLAAVLALITLSALSGSALTAYGFGLPASAAGSPLGFGAGPTSAIIALHRAVSNSVDADQVVNSARGRSAGGPLTVPSELLGADSAMAGAHGVTHFQDGALRNRNAEPHTKPVVCVRRVCNSKE